MIQRKREERGDEGGGGGEDGGGKIGTLELEPGGSPTLGSWHMLTNRQDGLDRLTRITLKT